MINRASLLDVASYAAREHRIDLSSLDFGEQRDLVISWDGDQPLSRLGDVTWDFQYETRQTDKYPGRMQIKFYLIFEDGSSLLDEAHSSLLHSTQCFLGVVLLTSSNPLGGKRKTVTIYDSIWSRLKVLLRWMVQFKYTCFSDLTKDRCLSYLQYLRTRAPRSNKSSSSALGSLRAHAHIIDLIWTHGPYLSDRLPEMPWRPFQVANILGNHVRGTPIEPIPSSACVELVSAALKYVEVLAPNIVRAEEAFHASYNKGDATSMVALRRDHKALASFGYATVHAFRRERRCLRAACLVLVLFFSGMRESELCSLARDSFFETEDSDAGTLCWLRGYTFKGRRFPEPCNWMVPEIVGRVVRVTVQLMSPLEAILQQQLGVHVSRTDEDRSLSFRQAKALGRLFITQKKRGMPVLPLSGEAVANDVAYFGDCIGLKDDQGNRWRLNVMQFRRTFASLVASHSLGDLRYLREHFKHWSIDQTSYYAHGAMKDDTLLDQIREHRKSMQSTLFSSWMRPSAKLAGGTGATVMAWRDMTKVRTAASRGAMIEAVSDGVVIRGTGHSYCLAQGYSCGGQGLYDAIRCGNCRDSVIDASLGRAWLQLREQQVELLESAECGVGMRERCLAQLQVCDEVLEKLGISTHG